MAKIKQMTIGFNIFEINTAGYLRFVESGHATEIQAMESLKIGIRMGAYIGEYIILPVYS